MKNVKIEATNNNTYVVRADTNRFGKNQIMFESYSKPECFEYVRQHGVKLTTCQHCGQLIIASNNRKYCNDKACMMDRGAVREFYWNGNFKSHAEEKAHMENLRERGYNNREIAKMIGRTSRCVLDNIGKQPKIMTELSKRLAGERRAKANQNRKIAVATAKRLEYERKVAEKEAILAERMRIAEQITKLRESYEAKTSNLIAVGHELLNIQPEYENAMNVLRSA